MVALDSFYPMTGVTEQLAQWQKFAPYYFGDGVVGNALNAFNAVQHAPPGMNIDVQSGRCFIQGVFGESGTTKTLTIAAADATNPRIDRVVLRCDTVAQDLEVLVITGTAAVSPSAPSLVRSATQTDYPVCQVLVGTTVTSVVTANITDERQYTSPRGVSGGQGATAAAAIQPYSPVAPLTEGQTFLVVTGTTTVSNIATSPTPSHPGAILYLEFATVGGNVHTGGNVTMSRHFTAGTVGAMLILFWDGGQWLELARSGEQAPAHQYYGNPTGTVAAATFASIVATDLPAYTTWTAVSITQGSTLTFTTSQARVTQFGKFVNINGYFTITSTGTTTTAVQINLPGSLGLVVTAAQCVGSFGYDDITVGWYAGVVQAVTGTQLQFQVHGQNNVMGVLPNFAAANGDILTFTITAELA